MASSSPGSQPTPPRAGVVLCGMLLALGGVLFLTMPRLLYSGDPIAIRLTSVNLINHGRIDVEPELAAQFGERGQYFFENTERQRWYSKYGVLNTLFYVPPLIAERLLAGELKQLTELDAAGRDRRCLLLNLWNVLVSLVLATYLFYAALLLGARPGPAALFVMLAVFGTFLWYYLRAQTVEILQVTLFTAATYHLWRFSLLPSDARSGFRGAGQAALALGLLGLLALSKLIYMPLVPLALLAVIVLAMRTENATITWPRLANLGPWLRARAPLLAASIGCTALVLGVALSLNWYRFGSPWSTGYTQFARESTLFRPAFEGVWGYLLDARKSILLYFPLLPLALLGMHRVPRDRWPVYAFVWIAFAALYFVNASFVNWRGDWSYGPRYLLFALPVLSLPLVLLLSSDGLLRRGRHVFAAVLLLASLLSINALFSIHGADWFAAFRVEQCFEEEETGNEALAAYFRQPHWRINYDLWKYRTGGETFPPLELVGETVSPEQMNRRIEQLRQVPLQNFYWPGQMSPAVAQRDSRAE